MLCDAAFSRLPARWNNKDILVMGEVLVRSPYHCDCVFEGPRAINDRVKTVVSVNTK